MIEFVWPWAFGLMILPLLIRFVLPHKQVNQGASLRMPGFQQPGSGERVQKQASRFDWLILLLIWLSLVLASARPLWLGDPITLPSKGRDLMVAVDLSGSMEYNDMVVNGQQVDRLVMVKHVLGDFIQRRVGDRLGLILFADTAYLQTPLTHDRETVQTMLDESVLGLVGEKTAIGDAIGLAAKRFDQQEETSKILILLTDGQNTAGNISPEDALKLAKDQKITVYTIGVGADEMYVQSFFSSRRVNPSRDLDETMLTTIANETGGQYFRARDTQALEEIYHKLDELEPIARDTLTMRPLTSLFHYPLGLAVILTLLFAVMRLWLPQFKRRSIVADSVNSVEESKS